MRKYTTITVDRGILRDLESVKREVKAESLGDAIEFLITFWRRARAKEFVRELSKARKDSDFSDIRRAINEVRGLRWARST